MNAVGFPALGEQYPRFKRINDLLWREYEQGKISKQGLVVERFNRFLGEMGVTADAKKTNDVYFARLSVTGYLLEGADLFLQELRKRGEIYLITNGTPAAQYGRLESLGLRNFFDGIFISDEIGFAKPDPRFFSYVLRKIGAKPADCMVIGDSLSSDIQGANNAGISCIWYTKSTELPTELSINYVAHSYAQILEILDLLPGFESIISN